MILVAGDIMLDVLLLPALRHEEQANGLLIRGGGSAANTAAWLGWSGADVTFVGCVGNDPAGAMLRDELARSGVGIAIRDVPEETGAVAVEITPEAERVMRSSRGANQMLAPRDLLEAGAALRPRAVHLTGYALLGPAGLHVLDAAARVAHDFDALLSFDPSSPGVIGRVGAANLLEHLAAARVGLFLPNHQEAEALTGHDDLEAQTSALGAIFDRVVIKAGASGAALSDRGSIAMAPTTSLAPVDTTGAGDAFNAGVLQALNGGENVLHAAQEGNRLAGRCCCRYGARPGDSD